MIQHDCGHGSFFRSRALNDMLGRIIGVFTLTPYEHWRKAHAIHHATSGNLDRRGIGDVDLKTVGEYLALSRRRRLVYRLYRNPFVFFGIGPTYLFVLKHRLPLAGLRGGRRAVLSVLGTNLAIAGVVALQMASFGVTEFLLVQAPITILASSIGVWLFFVQHQFERTYWARDEHWSFHEAALRSSSYLDLPRWLRWFTASIGIHHVHHLCSRIPNYRLQECLDDHAPLREISRLTLRDSLGCVRLALWDEDAKRLIGFRQLREGRTARTR
jgi:omega-6 fatty acid desaturase (delta-12 desaturase)